MQQFKIYENYYTMFNAKIPDHKDHFIPEMHMLKKELLSVYAVKQDE